MTLHTRLAKLERSRPAQSRGMITVELAPDLEARVNDAMQAGTFPQSLSLQDLRDLRDAVRKVQEGQA